MKDSFSSPMTAALTFDLQAFAGVCEEVLSLARREHTALSGQANYQPLEFDEKRKTLLPDIELLLRKLRGHRMAWQRLPQSQKGPELKGLFQNIQGLLTKVLALDRENQQAMLKRGLVPVKHLPAAAAQRPHFIADLYRRNSST